MSGRPTAAAGAAGHGGADADVLSLPRLMRGLKHSRLETPNADRDPIRYQWHTRPFASEGTLFKPPPRVIAAPDRLDSDDILAAVRRRIRSPPDRQIRERMHRHTEAPAGPGGGNGGGGGSGGGGELNSVMAHYLAASSMADAVLNRRLLQPAQQPGCHCCADVNYVNKMRRHRAARGVVPLPEQERLLGPPSSFHYHDSPDDLLLLEDHRRLRLVRAAPPELTRTEAELRLETNLRKLENSIRVLEEPMEQPKLPDSCAVREELEPGTDEYFRPGVLPTKYLPFAPRNPLRHPPPQLDTDAYRDRRRPGRAKYVSFSPRNPELRVYSPDASAL